MKHTIGFSFLLVLTILAFAGTVAINAIDYPTDDSLAREIGTELWNSMTRNQKQHFSPHCVLVTGDLEPRVQPVEIEQSSVAGRYVVVSQGCISLINNLAHAAAIDHVEPGYFRVYLRKLATGTADAPATPLPDIFHPQFWTREVINEQQSNFNQMIAMILAIHLAHHELGHFAKYKEAMRLPEGVAINAFLGAREWREAFDLGLHLALNAGYGVEGFRMFCEAFRQMPKLPAWTTYFLPPGLDVSSLQDRMEQAEGDFFDFSKDR